MEMESIFTIIMAGLVLVYVPLVLWRNRMRLAAESIAQ